MTVGACVKFATAQAPGPADAVALEQQGKLPEAAQAWRVVVRRNPHDAAAFASLGLVLSREEKFEEAVSAYHKAIALNPELPGVQLNLGLAEFKQGRFGDAIAPLRAALVADPGSRQAQTLLGLSYYGAKRFEEAVRQLKLAARAVSRQYGIAPECWRKAACRPGNTPAHSTNFARFSKKDPNSAAAHILAGEALDGLSRTPEAIAEFQAAAATSPREPNVHFGLGYLHWKMRQYDDASTEFEQELVNDPDHAQALAYLGDIEMKRNNPEKALSLLRKAVERRNDLRIAYLDMGVILAQQNHHQEALAALQHAERLDPAQPDAHLRLGRLYQVMGDKPAAQKEFARLRELHQKADDDIASKMSGPPPSLQH